MTYDMKKKIFTSRVSNISHLQENHGLKHTLGRGDVIVPRVESTGSPPPVVKAWAMQPRSPDLGPLPVPVPEEKFEPPAQRLGWDVFHHPRSTDMVHLKMPIWFTLKCPLGKGKTSEPKHQFLASMIHVSFRGCKV